MKNIFALVLLVLSLPVLSESTDQVEVPPQVLGYGVRSCSDYLKTYAGWEQEEELASLEYLRYRDWLTGFVTGLSLATGIDVLQGVDTKAAMRRIQIHCEDNSSDDVFIATTALIKLLSNLR